MSSSDSEASSSTRLHKKTKRKLQDSDESSSSDESEHEQTKEVKEPGADEEEEEEVEVLSHAEARRAKKRQKLMEKLASEKSTDPNAKSTTKEKGSAKVKVGKEKEKNDSKDKTTKRQNSVWVGNLSFKTTVEALKVFFGDAGEVTRVNMPMKADPRAGNVNENGNARGPGRTVNRGFAYVDFSTPEAKVAAIAMSEKNLDGRRLLIKDGDDFTGRPSAQLSPDAKQDDENQSENKKTSGHTKTEQRILAAQKQPPAPTLFLGNLGFETTEESIKEMIDAHARQKGKDKGNKGKGSGKGKERVSSGPFTTEPSENDGQAGESGGEWHGIGSQDAGIRKVRMGTFEDSGLCKGFAFVDFNSTEHATAVLINPRNHFLDGRKLVVEYASAEAVRRGGGPGAKERRLGKSKDSKKSQSDSKVGVEGGDRTHDVVMDDGEREDKKRERRPRRDDDRGSKRRAKPGAALALAQREKVSIVPSEGQKIKFT